MIDIDSAILLADTGCKNSARPIRSSIANRYVCAIKKFDISLGQEVTYQKSF